MFILDLCRELGKTQKELLDPDTGLDRDDLLEWMAYFRIKPFGLDEERRRVGMVCASIWNSAGKTIKSDVEWTDFFTPSWEDNNEQKKKSEFGVDVLVSIFESVAVRKED